MPPTVFLDTNIFKFSATALRRYPGRTETVQWGPLEVSGVVYTEQLTNPNDGIQNAELKEEVDLPPSVAAMGIDGRAEQLHFLSSLSNSRFLELQKATGAYQGDKPRNRNQLLDAFHFWCAEHNECDFFLTLDFKLIRVFSLSRTTSTVRLIRPSELLTELNGGPP